MSAYPCQQLCQRIHVDSLVVFMHVNSSDVLTTVQSTKLKALVNLSHVSPLDLVALAVGQQQYVDLALRPPAVSLSVC